MSESEAEISLQSALTRLDGISYGSTLSVMSNKVQFPSFLRTVPSDKFQAFGISSMLLHFGWTWVGIVASDNLFSREGSQQLKSDFIQAGGCVTFYEIIPLQNEKWKIVQIAELIKRSTANVIVIFCRVQHVTALMEEVLRQNVIGKVWIGATSTTISADFSELSKNALNGSVGFAIHRGEIAGFKEFLNNIHPVTSRDDIFVRSFWEAAFGCQWADAGQGNISERQNSSTYCTGEERVDQLDPSLFDVNNFRITYSVYNAVLIVAHALHNMISCKPGEGPFHNGSCVNQSDFKSWQLLHYMRMVHLKNKAGEQIFFDANGDPPAVYDIQNWQVFPDGTNRYIKVGSFNSSAPEGQKIAINDIDILWDSAYKKIPTSVCSESCPIGYRKATRQGQPPCCFDCFPCPKGEISNHSDVTECTKCQKYQWPNGNRDKCEDKVIEFLSYEEPLGMALAIIAVIFFILTACILAIFVKNHDTAIVRANNRQLSFLLLVALMMCFLCSLIFIGQPVMLSCQLRQPTFGIIFSICVSSVLAKTTTVVIAFSATSPNSSLKRWVGPKTPAFIVVSSTLLQVLICLLWLVMSPSYPNQNINTRSNKVILECIDSFTEMFYIMLGYLGILAVLSFITAFFARKLPDSFNEAKYISFSMIVFVSVWISFIPAYLSTQGKYMVVVEIFAIVSSSAGLLSCIFFPKCYIIVLRPDANIRDHLIGKTNPAI
ncbi:extracellular calcium-sensing receptor-like [Protopterus annectens]|uniref:extracellular calcium-sensing receptor-like n=1 Tax=Protopterus annectens TaxID=7888 RepID=UPI001CFB56F4|nr:extracellular calcium-sensing receptor-like [Protopterus annectens]